MKTFNLGIMSSFTLNSIYRKNLVKGCSVPSPIKEIHSDWHLHQATLMSEMKNTDSATQAQLQLAVLHGYSKVATIGETQCEIIGSQCSPFLPDVCRYHRITRNELLSRVDSSYAQDLGFTEHEVHLIDSPLISEVFARDMPQKELKLDVSSYSEFEALIDQVVQKGVLDQVLINITQLIPPGRVNSNEIRKIVTDLEDIIIKKIQELLNGSDDRLIDVLLTGVRLIAFTTHKQENILLAPEFLERPDLRFTEVTNRLLSRRCIRACREKFDDEISSIMSRNGYRICPAQAKSAWLKIDDIASIFAKTGIPVATLREGRSPIQVCKSYKDFMGHKIVKKFRQLSSARNAPPYLKIIPEATIRLLEGFLQYPQGIDAAYEAKGLKNLLQISYLRMLRAMKEVLAKKSDMTAFNNNLEIIHQEIQDILAILQPYSSGAFAQCITEKLTEKPNPVIPDCLKVPKAYLKASAMHGLSSILSGVEAQKRTNCLNVVVLEASYYLQSDETIRRAKTYQVSVLNGDLFEESGIEGAFDHFPRLPIDLFVTEFHHNIQVNRQVYRSENILKQVKTMYEKGLVADKFTVVIDTTIDLEKSEDVQDFLADKIVQNFIRDGKLNVVLLRSAQKFDMLGMDNYYGGIVVTVNEPGFFDAFDERMRVPEDQLKGLCYQGLTHLQKYCGQSLDAFRKGIMENTQMLYNKLKSNAIYREGSKNPLQVSQIRDNRLFFLDFKFPTTLKPVKFLARAYSILPAKIIFLLQFVQVLVLCIRPLRL